MQQALKEKLQNVVERVNTMMADPDIDIEYNIQAEGDKVVGDPVILVHYSENKYVTKKIRLSEKYLGKSIEEIANLVTFSIEQFKEDIDSVNVGA